MLKMLFNLIFDAVNGTRMRIFCELVCRYILYRDYLLLSLCRFCYNFIVFVRIAKPSETKATNQCHTFLPMHRAIATNAIAAKLSKNHQITSFVTQNNSLGYISKCVSHRGRRFRVQRPPRNKNHLLAHIFLFFFCELIKLMTVIDRIFIFFCDPKINFQEIFRFCMFVIVVVVVIIKMCW